MVWNEFEKLVVSLCHAENITCFDEYFLSKPGFLILEKADKTFFGFWARGFAVPRNLHPAAKKSEIGSKFEVDCCIQFTTTTALRDIFVDVIQGEAKHVFPLNDDQATWEDVTIRAQESISFEFTEKSTHISKKLWQLERYLMLADSCGLPPLVAAGVIVSGTNEDFQAAVKSIDKHVWKDYAGTLKIFSIPVFILYTPYRNLFTEVADVKSAVSKVKQDLSDSRKDFNDRFDTMDNRFDKMDKRFDKMDKRFDKMDNRFDDVDNRFDQMHDMIMLLIPEADLLKLCLSQGLSVPAPATKQNLIDLLTANRNDKNKAGCAPREGGNVSFCEGGADGATEEGDAVWEDAKKEEDVGVKRSHSAMSNDTNTASEPPAACGGAMGREGGGSEEVALKDEGGCSKRPSLVSIMPPM
jgi:hypothetical protein